MESRTWTLLAVSLLAALAGAQAAGALVQATTTSTMADYRIRGYMLYSRLIGGANSSCATNFIMACALQGPWLLRASSDAIKIEGPSSAVADLGGVLIDCPEAILDVSDPNSANPVGVGSFPADSVKPGLVPETPLNLQPSGTANTLQLRPLNNPSCIYEFTLTRSTNYILGVQPLEWISWLSAAGARAPSAAAVLLSGLAAAALVHVLR